MPGEADLLARPRASSAPADGTTDTLTWLIDNAEAYRAVVAALRDARRTIWISQLALDADCEAYELDPSRSTSSTTTIVHELVAAARRGIAVRVLLNASLLLDTVKPLRAHLAAAEVDERSVRVRGVSEFPQLLHAKMVIVDDETAILVGSPFANGYWDDRRHPPVDARRPLRELGGRPVHDVSTQLAGPVVVELCSAFAAMWNDATDVADDDRDPLPAAADDAEGDGSAARVVRTAPGDGPTDILPALLDGIGRARELVYIEHQYLSARPVVDALVDALARHHLLEVVVVLNQNPDVTAYRGWQNARLRESGLAAHPRVGLFALWTSAMDGRRHRRRLNQVFVHSKVVAVDDRWALVGSANLDGVSLHSYGDDFDGALGRRIFRGVRNFDVGVVLDADRGDAAAEQVHALRSALWCEHLGVAFHDGQGRPAGGWLPLWRSLARRNVDELGRHRQSPFLEGPFILPYSARSTPRAQLADVGVLFAPAEIELCFEPSWLEVHLSPNWIRNMFG